jgi:hypothetical protein
MEKKTEMKEEKAKKPAAKAASSAKIAVVRVRGQIHVRYDMNDTMKMLKLIKA